MRTGSFIFAALVLGCQTFDPPPEVTIEGAENGVMTTQPDAPFVLRFSEPIKQSSFSAKLVEAVLDAEGNLLDEKDPPDLEGFAANTLVAFDGGDPGNEDKNFGATFTLTDDKLTMEVDAGFEISTPYLALIEPHLEDKDGHFTIPRQRLPFAFQLEGGGPTTLPTGYYYWVFDIEPPPLQTQIQVYSYMQVDPLTGQWRAIFTNANRRPALNSRPGCPSCSGDTPVCALIPAPRCLKPSEKQASLEEYVDFLPEPDPPDGYIFIADGFARDEPNGTISLGTAPFLIDITIGTGGIHIEAINTKVIGGFADDGSGRLLATGSISVDRVDLNGIAGDPTKGEFKAMSLTAEEVAAVEAFGYPIPTDLGAP
jgi:hypothetical protein